MIGLSENGTITLETLFIMRFLVHADTVAHTTDVQILWNTDGTQAAGHM